MSGKEDTKEEVEDKMEDEEKNDDQKDDAKEKGKSVEEPTDGDPIRVKWGKQLCLNFGYMVLVS